MNCEVKSFNYILTWLSVLFTASNMFFNSCQMVYFFQNEISVSTHYFQHITKSCQSQYNLSHVENHAQEIINYNDGNEILDWCGLTISCYTRWITMFTFETELELTDCVWHGQFGIWADDGHVVKSYELMTVPPERPCHVHPKTVKWLG